MVIGIILAAGKGTRLKSVDQQNKVTLPFLNKPLITYSVELMQTVCDKTVVVVGAFAESVRVVLKNYPVVYAYQKEQLGTGHAAKVGLEKIAVLQLSPDLILVGYGDHTMFYQKKTIEKLIKLHKDKKAAISIITFLYNEPNKIAFGRIIKNKNGFVVDDIEQKDATDEQKKIKELNAGFYCFDYQFLKANINKVKKSPVSGEYYINSLIKIAAGQDKKVVAFKVPFGSAGIGVNKYEELEESQRIYLKTKRI